MLVLTRKHDEKVVLPELEIEICVLKIRGGSVAIGINAPRKIKILRGELHNEEYCMEYNESDHRRSDRDS